MAKTKEEKAVKTAAETEVKEVKEVKEAKVTKTTKSEGPSQEELLAIIQEQGKAIEALKQMVAMNNTTPAPTSNRTEEILDLLANRKSDKEITIVHNCELIGGLSTHIELTGVTIDFHTLGEERVLNWQQFEECVSKYRSFFEKQIILVSDEYSEVAQRYSIPCVNRSGKHVITHEEISKLGKMDVHKLEEFVESLTESDKEFVFSYWLGKCYTKEQPYYDRYKVEMLNRLSGKHVFDNLLTLMNGDFAVDNDTK